MATRPTSTRVERVRRPARRAAARAATASRKGEVQGRPQLVAAGRDGRAARPFPARRSVRPSAKRQVVAEERQPAAVSRRDRQARHRLRHRAGRHRQDLPGDGAGGVVPAGQEACQPHHPGAAGGRGGREARVPARRPAGEGQPVPAAALRRAATTCSTPSASSGCSSAARSRSRRWPSCAAARSTTRSSSSTRRRTRPREQMKMFLTRLGFGSQGGRSPATSRRSTCRRDGRRG